jgi:virulence factor Mce-like protein
VLIAVVAVFLAYNANNSLPFVPVYRLKVELPDANTLVAGNEVRIGGVRVGRVNTVTPTRLDDGTPVAIADLSLNEQVKPLPADTTVMVRSRSTIALKYLELTPGKSETGLEDGATIPMTSAKPEPVELDQVINTFNPATRHHIQKNLQGFGDALAGRGVSINQIFGTLATLVDSAEPALRNLAAPETRFGDFWRALENMSSAVAPVADQQAQLFVNLDQTFAAFAEVSRPYIQETISKSPATLDEAQRSLPVIRPFFRHSAQFFTALGPGVNALSETSPTLVSAFETGIPVLRRAPRLNNELEPTAQALLDFQNAAGVKTGLSELIDTNNLLDPSLRFLTPAQTTCNYLTLLFRNAASIGSIGDGAGSWTRFIAFAPPIGPNSEAAPSSAPANGQGAAPSNRLNYLHYNPYPNTAAPGQPEECEAGNEIYELGKQVIGNPTNGKEYTGTEGQNVVIGLDGKPKEQDK